VADRDIPETHHHTCERGDDCVECGGCDCGLNERTCTGPGCYSVEAYDQWCDENGYHEEGSYG
jgi:hypothetical protein